MPVTKSANKALRKDRRRTLVNQKIITKLKRSIKQARKNPSLKNLQMATSALDRAAKKKVIHPNKAARLKSRLAKVKKLKKKD